jgi:ribosomal protein S30
MRISTLPTTVRNQPEALAAAGKKYLNIVNRNIWKYRKKIVSLQQKSFIK